MRLAVGFAVGFLLLAAAPVAAQGSVRPPDTIPTALRPPPGMCRVWLANVPAGKQAAPTDCATAVRNRPANGVVVFGDSSKGRGSSKAPPKLPSKAVPPPGPTSPKVVPPPPAKPPPRKRGHDGR